MRVKGQGIEMKGNNRNIRKTRKSGRRLMALALGVAMAITAVFVVKPENDAQAAVAFDAQAQSGQWKQDATGWWYQFADGTWAANKWVEIGGVYYHFDKAGYMEADAYIDNYYVNKKGVCADSSVPGWKKNTAGWSFYLDEKSVLKKCWKRIDGEWYYFNSLGIMETGWLRYKGTWYYLARTGEMVTGAKTIRGVDYVFDASGALIEDNEPVPNN